MAKFTTHVRVYGACIRGVQVSANLRAYLGRYKQVGKRVYTYVREADKTTIKLKDLVKKYGPDATLAATNKAVTPTLRPATEAETRDYFRCRERVDQYVERILAQRLKRRERQIERECQAARKLLQRHRPTWLAKSVDVGTFMQSRDME